MENMKTLISEKSIDIDSERKKYIDNRLGFIPTSEQEQVALEVAEKLGDRGALNFHLVVVKEIGVNKARELCALTLEDAKVARETGKKPIDNLGSLYNWKVSKFRQRRENA